MKVTIVIPNYNGKHFMEPCLSSLSEQTYKNFHILVVDNASSDGSIEYMDCLLYTSRCVYETDITVTKLHTNHNQTDNEKK